MDLRGRPWLLGAVFLLLAVGEARTQCLECHSQADSSISFANGDTREVTIDPAAWESSVHGSLGFSCTDCHADISEYPHPELSERSSRQLTLRLSLSCQQCHQEQSQKMLDGVHQAQIASGNEQSAVCADCHDPHTQQKITGENGELLPPARLSIPRTCAPCHGLVDEQYRQSVHGAALFAGNPDVPTCTDCHGVHDIRDPRTAEYRLQSPRMCADCHTDGARMDKYGLSTQVLRTYVADFHGSTVTLFQRRHPDQVTNKPVCYDCHGVHDIASKNDPTKGLRAKENLLRTCRKCHPGASAAFPDAWLSHYVPTRHRAPLVYWARVGYRVLIPGVVGGMLFFVGTDFYRRRREARGQAGRRTEHP